MKAGDIVYRKAPFTVIAIADEKDKDGNVLRTHLQLQAVENTQYVNCLTTDVETNAV